MNESTSRIDVALAVTAVLVTATLTWSLFSLNSAHDAAQRAAKAAEKCETISQEIQSLREQPIQAGVRAKASSELSAKIPKTVQEEKLPHDSIVSIDAQPATRLADSDYKQQTTVVQIQRMTIAQFMQFAHRLLSDQAGLKLQRLRLAAPRRKTADEQTEKWQIEMALTYFIYAPKTPKSR